MIGCSIILAGYRRYYKYLPTYSTTILPTQRVSTRLRNIKFHHFFYLFNKYELSPPHSIYCSRVIPNLFVRVNRQAADRNIHYPWSLLCSLEEDKYYSNYESSLKKQYNFTKKFVLRNYKEESYMFSIYIYISGNYRTRP